MSNAPKKAVIFFDDPKFAPCVDGRSSALAAAMALEEQGYQVEKVGFAHGDTEERKALMAKYAGEDVEAMFVDIAPDKAEMDWLMSTSPEGVSLGRMFKRVNILDHHLTTANNFPNCDTPRLYVNVDVKQPSAAQHVWETMMPDKKMPKFFNFVGKMEPTGTLGTDAEYAIAAYVDYMFKENPDDVFGLIEHFASLSEIELVRKGNMLHRRNKMDIEELFENETKYALLPMPDGSSAVVPVVPADLPKYGRYIDHAMVTEGRKWMSPGFCIAYTQLPNGDYKMSFRADKKGVDTLPLIDFWKEQGIGKSGGGHRNASVLVAEELPALMSAEEMWKILTNVPYDYPEALPAAA